MKENLSAKIHGSRCFKETDSFNIGNHELCKFKDSSQDKTFSSFELKGLHNCQSNEKETADSSATHKLFQGDIDCDLPEMEVCYKEIDDQGFKDICVDEGTFGTNTSTITHRKYEGEVELELFISRELEPFLINHPWKISEASPSPAGKAAFSSSKEERELNPIPIQEFGTSSLLRSFLHTLNGNVNEFGALHEDVEAISLLNDHKGDREAPCTKSSRSSCESNEIAHKNPTNGNTQMADNASFVDQWKYDEGETSFYADRDSFITYSGSIPFSGSLSHRSDSSATSGKSFAFPVLQSEWNSSPVRMAKGEKRYLRKHKKDWKSRCLCCGLI